MPFPSVQRVHRRTLRGPLWGPVERRSYAGTASFRTSSVAAAPGREKDRAQASKRTLVTRSFAIPLASLTRNDAARGPLPGGQPAGLLSKSGGVVVSSDTLSAYDPWLSRCRPARSETLFDCTPRRQPSPARVCNPSYNASTSDYRPTHAVSTRLTATHAEWHVNDGQRRTRVGTAPCSPR